MLLARLSGIFNLPKKLNNPTKIFFLLFGIQQFSFPRTFVNYGFYCLRGTQFIAGGCCFTCFDGCVNEIGEVQLLLLASGIHHFFSVSHGAWNVRYICSLFP